MKKNPVEHTILKITGDTYAIFIITKEGHCLLPNIAGPRKREFFDIQIKNKILTEFHAVKIIDKFWMHKEIIKDVKNSKYYML